MLHDFSHPLHDRTEKLALLVEYCTVFFRLLLQDCFNAMTIIKYRPN